MLDKIESDLKAALLARDKQKVDVLKGIKTAVQYDAVAKGLKIQDLSDEQIQTVLGREAKKRQDAIDIYTSAGEDDRAAAESQEMSLIAQYLPPKLSPEEVESILHQEIAKLDSPSIKDLGRLIGAVKSRAGAGADGSEIARLAKQLLEQN